MCFLHRVTKLLVAVFVVVSFSLGMARAESENDSICRVAVSMLKEATEIRELQKIKDVPCQVSTENEVRSYLTQQVDEKFPKEHLQAEEYIFKAIGMLPQEYDYREGIISVYLSEIAGYYDPVDDHFVMAGWMPSLAQVPIAVHELTHALQDQHYDLDSFVDLERYTTDELFARASLVEGDATAVMFDYFRRSMRQPRLAESESVVEMATLLGSPNTDHPKSMVAMMVFPYAGGLNFVHALLRKGGYKAVDKAFAHPPRTSEEIIHPDLYFKVEPDFTSIPEKDLLSAAGVSNGKVTYSDVLGEFTLRALLEMFVSTEMAASGAAGWAGDRVGIVSSADGKHRTVVLVTKWDSIDEAKEFQKMYADGMRAMYGSGESDALNEVPGSLGRKVRISRTENEVKIVVPELSR